MQGLKNIIQTVLTVVMVFGVTTALYLYTSGFRLKRDETNVIDVSKTGMVSAKSIPESASVYLDGQLLTATNDTISGVQPGTHKLKIVKKGFVEWLKDIEVFPELVTDITAVLVSQSPRLEPLTNTGAKNPSVSPTLSKLAYFSTDASDPGIWIIPLKDALNIFRSAPTVAIEDTRFAKYSEGKSLTWSPDENQLLVEGNNSIYYLVDLSKNTAETTMSPERVINDWRNKLQKKREDFLQKLDLTDALKQLALSPKTMWAPDEKKFLYTTQNGDKIEYKVYNLEKPLPVGERVDTLVFTSDLAKPQPSITWYSDSFHLILTEGSINENKQGVVSIIRIDGTNKTEIYNNTLMSDRVFSTPDGQKVIVLTSFKSGTQTDLYTVSVR